MCSLASAALLFIIGLLFGIGLTLVWSAKFDGYDGDQPLPPYDDEEGWK